MWWQGRYIYNRVCGRLLRAGKHLDQMKMIYITHFTENGNTGLNEDDEKEKAIKAVLGTG